MGHKKVLVSMYALGELCFIALALTSNVIALYLLVALGGACTVGTQNLANPYISEYYPKEARATGIGWALGVGRIGAILAPTLIGILLATGIAPQKAFMFFAIPNVVGVLTLICVQEKFASFDKVVQRDHKDMAMTRQLHT